MLAESIHYCVKQFGSKVCLIPENTTSYCQPLDMGVMGPVKAMIWNIQLADTTKTNTALEQRKWAIQLTIVGQNEVQYVVFYKLWTKLFIYQENKLDNEIKTKNDNRNQK